MGLTIHAPGDGPPWPTKTLLALTCDNCAAFAVFDHADGFIAQYRQAIAAGWKDTHSCSPGSARTFLGPCCSGKIQSQHAAESPQRSFL